MTVFLEFLIISMLIFSWNVGKAPKYLSELLRRALELAGTQDALAELLGVTQPNVSGYLSGRQMPSLSVFERLLQATGGDLMRALPDWSPDDYEGERLKDFPILGTVTAGTLQWSPTRRLGRVKAPIDYWQKSKYWNKNTSDVRSKVGSETIDSEVVLLQIVGNSMEPQYPDGSLIACRAVVDPMQLSDNTPCIFRERGSGETFKLLRWTKGKKHCIGMPINPEHPPVIFNEDSDVQITMVVVGTVDQGRD